ncbi:MAG: hypothetical protein U5L45_04780 [Saprospiraceae bacterium]|nr:hypothetical protein [Saprospiraceae bacterium]
MYRNATYPIIQSNYQANHLFSLAQVKREKASLGQFSEFQIEINMLR